jgi:hypothetical protein
MSAGEVRLKSSWVPCPITVNMNNIFCLFTSNTNRLVLIDSDKAQDIAKFEWQESPSHYIARCDRQNGTHLLHRVITNAPPKIDADHINRLKWDNRSVNLRLCTRSQNCANALKSTGKSKYKGVYWNKERRKWQAQITHNYKTRSLGRYNTEQEAALVYNKAAKETFGEFAYLNSI